MGAQCAVVHPVPESWTRFSNWTTATPSTQIGIHSLRLSQRWKLRKYITYRSNGKRQSETVSLFSVPNMHTHSDAWGHPLYSQLICLGHSSISMQKPSKWVIRFVGEKELPLIMIQENRSVWFISNCITIKNDLKDIITLKVDLVNLFCINIIHNIIYTANILFIKDLYLYMDNKIQTSFLK